MSHTNQFKLKIECQWTIALTSAEKDAYAAFDLMY